MRIPTLTSSETKQLLKLVFNSDVSDLRIMNAKLKLVNTKLKLMNVLFVLLWVSKVIMKLRCPLTMLNQSILQSLACVLQTKHYAWFTNCASIHIRNTNPNVIPSSSYCFVIIRGQSEGRCRAVSVQYPRGMLGQFVCCIRAVSAQYPCSIRAVSRST